MSKKITLRTQLNLGFTAVLALLVIVAGTAYWGLHDVFIKFSEYQKIVSDSNTANNLQAQMFNVQLDVRTFINKPDDKTAQNYREHFNSMRSTLDQMQKSTDRVDHLQLINLLSDQASKYDAAFSQIVTLERTRSDVVSGLIKAGVNIQSAVLEILDSASKDGNAVISTLSGKLQIQFMDGRYLALRYVFTRNQQDFEKAKEAVIDKVDLALKALKEGAKGAYQPLIKQIEDQHKNYAGLLPTLFEATEEANGLIQNILYQIGPVVLKTTEELKTSYDADRNSLGSDVKQTNELAIVIVSSLSILAVLIGIGLSWLLVRRIQRVVGQITQAVRHVSLAIIEIAQGSTDLSQRTEEQASALEQTASSMEELTSTVKQSADNAAQANQLASTARHQADQGGEVVSQAIIAMDAISQSSRKIADIISVIDEIAFQTNLLALNAAVEAARAGEQGRGFAVVAGEVRKLAQRSANAAKEIKSLITDSVRKVDDGGKLVEQSGQTLKEIVTAIKKVSDIVAEMAAAAREQATGIEQVNKAILQMDQVTQQNAALVEQTAAASQIVNSQVHELGDLMVFFATNRRKTMSNTMESESESASANPNSGATAAMSSHGGKARTADLNKSKARATAAHKLLSKKQSTAVESEDWDHF